jgi:C4-dicarboxylate-specific signal transduction histidine kinase
MKPFNLEATRPVCTTPTEQAMTAVRMALPCTASAADHHHPDCALRLRELALAIDTATGLPALLAERDALRKALERLLDEARSALALSGKGQP